MKLGKETRARTKNCKREKIPSTQISGVLQHIDAEHQEGTGKELREELARLGHEISGVCGEYSSCRCVGVPWDGAYVCAAFEDIDGGFVVSVED